MSGLLELLEEAGEEFSLWRDRAGIWNITTTWDHDIEADSACIVGRGLTIADALRDALCADEDPAP